jgi:hypothetical protein
MRAAGPIAVAVAAALVAAVCTLPWLRTWNAVAAAAVVLYYWVGSAVRIVRGRTPGGAGGGSDGDDQGEVAPIVDEGMRDVVERMDSFDWVIDVNIECARALRAADPPWFWQDASSDPYCLAEVIGGQQRHKTKTRSRDLNPQWNEKFELAVHSLRAFTKITVL